MVYAGLRWFLLYAGPGVASETSPGPAPSEEVFTLPSAWLEVHSPLEIPPIACCYVLIFDRTFVYVGQTINLKQRIMQHMFRYRRPQNTLLTPWGEAKTLSIKYKPSRVYGDWLMTEARLIKRLRPVLNITGSGSLIRKRSYLSRYPLVKHPTGGPPIYASVEQFANPSQKLTVQNSSTGVHCPHEKWDSLRRL